MSRARIVMIAVALLALASTSCKEENPPGKELMQELSARRAAEDQAPVPAKAAPAPPVRAQAPNAQVAAADPRGPGAQAQGPLEEEGGPKPGQVVYDRTVATPSAPSGGERRNR